MDKVQRRHGGEKMWLFVSIPMVSIFTVLASGYLQKDKILENERKRIDISKVFPKDFKYIIFLLAAFIIGMAVFAVQYNYFGEYIKASKLTFLIMLLAPIAYVDFKSHKIPNVLVLAGIMARFVFYIIEMISSNKTVPGIFLSDMKGVLLVCGILLLGTLITKNGVGVGDIKMYAVIAMFMGYSGTVFSLIISLFVCFLVSIVLLVTGKKTGKNTLPFAPFVYIGTLIAIFLGS